MLKNASSVHMTGTATRAWLLLLIAGYGLWWWWILQYPMALSSDDALNFSRAIERFSVLEFRPHFPGYPGFVMLCRLLATVIDPSTANIGVSVLAASLLPLLAARLVYLLCGSYAGAICCAFMLFSQPLLAAVALSGLSDSMALALFFMALIAAFKQRNFQFGLWLGLMLSVRPSYFPLAIGLGLLPMLTPNCVTKLKTYWQAGSMILLVGLVSLLFVLRHEGSAYFVEGLRFTQGHFSLWGNTAVDNTDQLGAWLISLQKSVGAPLLALIAMTTIMAFWQGFHRCRYLLVIATITLIFWGWISVAQNPNNLRHWLPVFVLFSVMLPLVLNTLSNDRNNLDSTIVLRSKQSLVAVVAIAIVINSAKWPWFSMANTPRQAPIQQAISWFEKHQEAQVIGTNYSVKLAQEQLVKRQVYDVYYPSSRYQLYRSANTKAGSAWRISATKLAQHKLVREFPARFVGERPLFLYQISQNQK